MLHFKDFTPQQQELLKRFIAPHTGTTFTKKSNYNKQELQEILDLLDMVVTDPLLELMQKIRKEIKS